MSFVAELDFSSSEYTLRRCFFVGPDKKKYCLVEASELAAKKFESYRSSMMNIGAEGTLQRIEGVGELPSLLVSLCLFLCEDGNGQELPETAYLSMAGKRNIIEGWGHRIVRPLYERALEISDLDNAKNPVKESLHAAFSHPESPLTLKDFVTYVERLEPNKIYNPLKRLFKGEDGSIKNSPASLTGTSESIANSGVEG